MKEIIKKIEKDKLLLMIDTEIFEKEAILQASYKYTKKCFINIEKNDNKIEVYFIPKYEGLELEKLALEFGNEVIDQQIRLVTRREYQEIREKLVAKAFSSINK
ncbi:MAG: His-Xaa-Ser system protein HxsD [bacterium]